MSNVNAQSASDFKKTGYSKKELSAEQQEPFTFAYQQTSGTHDKRFPSENHISTEYNNTDDFGEIISTPYKASNIKVIHQDDGKNRGMIKAQNSKS